MDKVTPRKILEDDLFIKAFAEYIKLPIRMISVQYQRAIIRKFKSSL